MRCASGLFNIKTTKGCGTHMRKLNFFGWKSEEKVHVHHLRPFTPSLPYPINQTTNHIGKYSTSSLRSIFRELLICNSTVRFEIPRLSDIS